MNIKPIGNFYRGIVPNKPKLPILYQYIEHSGEWLLARRADGATYFVTDRCLYRRRKSNLWDYLRTFGRKKIGRYYVDTRQPIYLQEWQ